MRGKSSGRPNSIPHSPHGYLLSLCNKRGLWPCGGQSAGTALMAIVRTGCRKLAYVSTVQAITIKTRRMRVCPPQGVFPVFVYLKHPPQARPAFINLINEQTSNDTT